MKYQKNYLGFNKHLEEILNEKLKLLNKSIKEIIRNNKELSNIKNLEFFFDSTIEETPFLLKVSGQLRSGEAFLENYFRGCDNESIAITDSEIQSYYGESKKNDIINFLNDNYGNLDYTFLQVYEPILLNQLCQDYIINMTPNTEYGLSIMPEDIDFIKRISIK
jgi:hypothetical protein